MKCEWIDSCCIPSLNYYPSLPLIYLLPLKKIITVFNYFSFLLVLFFYNSYFLFIIRVCTNIQLERHVLKKQLFTTDTTEHLFLRVGHENAQVSTQTPAARFTQFH